MHDNNIIVLVRFRLVACIFLRSKCHASINLSPVHHCEPRGYTTTSDERGHDPIVDRSCGGGCCCIGWPSRRSSNRSTLLKFLFLFFYISVRFQQPSPNTGRVCALFLFFSHFSFNSTAVLYRWPISKRNEHVLGGGGGGSIVCACNERYLYTHR